MDVHVRPRILLLSREEPAAVRAVVEGRLRANAGRLDGRVTHTQMVVWIIGEERRLWSPSLEVNCRAHPAGTLIVGKLGPHMFLFSAMIFSFIGTGLVAALSLCWSYVQWSLGEPSTAIVGVLPLIVAVAFFAILDRLGRRRAHGQMIELARLLNGLGKLVADEEGVLREAEALRVERELGR